MEIQVVEKSSVVLANPTGRGKWDGLREQMRNLPENQAVIVTPNGQGVVHLAKLLTLSCGKVAKVRRTADGKIALFRK